jgi:O-antigen/teichoic acid export membrane protein
VLLRTLYGEAFVPAVLPLRILLVEVTLAGAAAVLAQGFHAAGRPGVAALVLGSSVAVALGALLCLVPRFGMLGAAAAMLAGTAWHLAGLSALFRPVLGAPLPRLLPRAGDLAPLYRLARLRTPHTPLAPAAIGRR